MSVNREHAFPRAGCNWTEDHGDDAFAQDGMTLRDYFAAKALEGLTFAFRIDWRPGTPVVPRQLAEDLAEASFKIADAMLAERAKGAT